MRPTKIGSELRFLWHVTVTDHRISFDEHTWAITCDCGRVFYPLGLRKVLVIPLGPWEIRKVRGGRPPSHYAPPTTVEIGANPTAGLWDKRNTSSGHFDAIKRSGDVFKGIKREN